MNNKQMKSLPTQEHRIEGTKLLADNQADVESCPD
jgi:hypothetical protein